MNELMEAAGVKVKQQPGIKVEGLNYDSRCITKGDLFFAVKGHHVDGHQFISQAAAKGAVAAVAEHPVPAAIPVFPVRPR